MLKTRVIPCLLLKNRALVKTIKFKNPTYVGDAINTVRIYNEKEVDEIVFLDITATLEGKEPPFDLIEEIASECFMPFAYGGAIKNIQQVTRILSLGVEKVIINSSAFESPNFIRQISDKFGSQCVVVSIDVKRNFWGKYQVRIRGGEKSIRRDPIEYAKEIESKGAGEILLTSIDRDGTMQGYDLDLIRMVTSRVSIPVIACGGAGSLDDFGMAVRDAGASAVAAGSMVVYQGKNRAVLVNFPSKNELKKALA